MVAVLCCVNLINHLLVTGIEDVNGVDGPLNTDRFTFVDGDLEGLNFFDNAGRFPWRSNRPDNPGGAEDCVS